MSRNFLDDLNPVQREAVTYGEGPLLVFAGAGSGKTRVLTYRIAYLLAERGVAPRQILACTFTNKAANEMKERIVRLVGSRSRGMWIGTFHSLCARMLREYVDRLGRQRNFVIFDEADQLALLRECLRELDLDEKQYPPRTFGYRISGAKNALLGVEEFAQDARYFTEQLTAEVYRLYERKLAENNALDFDDLILYTVRLFEEHPDVLATYQERFRYVLVDEYQDINHSQYRFLQLLAGKYRNLCVVGDDDQSIYGFRGADMRLILQFERDWPEAKIVKLEQNYRSTQRILEAANAVIAHNQGRRPKVLWTENPVGVPALLHEASNEHEEAFFVANTINALVRQGYAYADCAVLYRTHAQSRVFEDVLLNLAIPYRIVGGLRFYERKEIKDLLAYLRVLYNPADNMSLLRILNVPPRGIGSKTQSRLQRLAAELGGSLYEACVYATEEEVLSPTSARAVRSFVRLLESLREEAEQLPLAELVDWVAERSGYLEALQAEHTLEAAARLENLQELVTVAREFEEQHEDSSLRAFLENMALISDVDQLSTAANAVTLLTLHSAKGLEFPVVFIVGLEEGLFPHARSLDNGQELEEERRLCYVGMTRAKERLYLTYAWQRTLYGRTELSTPSRFLSEIPEEFLQTEGGWPVVAPAVAAEPSPAAGLDLTRILSRHRRGEMPAEDATRAPTEPLAFNPGQKVRHPTFGEGIVIACKGSGPTAEVKVVFKGRGEKTLLLEYAKLEAI
ncbi:MAG TPA: DNA helicase PcrA [Armatimonadetes bacterium]|nr:DNA helicase PcrA [Armatimonadota bacterium]